MSDHQVAEILSELLYANPGKIGFLIGAGCSKSAGIPIANEITMKLLEKLFHKDSMNGEDKQIHIDEGSLIKWLESQKWYDPLNPYSSTLDRSFSCNRERCVFFEQLIKEKKPTATHLGLALIMKSGLSSVILTPNFDRLIEHAIIHVCKRIPAVSLYNSDPHYMNLESPRPKVLKLHGDYLYGNIRNLEHELSLVKHSMSTKLQKASFKRGIIVCGYSGSDSTIMESLEQLSIDKNNFEMGIHWLTRKSSKPNHRVINLIEKTRDRGSCIYEIDGSDSFFIELSLATEKYVKLGSTSMLDSKAHIDVLDEKAKRDIASKCLDNEDLSEFLWLVKRNETISGMVDTVLSFDYIMARYEELGDLPYNLGECMERYIDFLLNGWLYEQSPGYSYYDIKTQLVDFYSSVAVIGNEFELDFKSHPTDKSIQMINMIINSGLVKSVQKNRYSFNIHFEYYLIALLLKNKTSNCDLLTYLNENKFPILCYYVGMIDDASKMIAEVADFKMDTAVQSLIGPWPREFYMAAELVGCAQYVDLEIAKSISDRIFMDIDSFIHAKEKYPPSEAIRALPKMKGTAVEQTIKQLVSYIGDLQQDLFSREDAAMALGIIGSRSVVDCLDQCLNHWPDEKKKMVLYALGLTSNPRAVKVIKSHWEAIPFESRNVAKDALNALGCVDIPVESEVHIKKVSDTSKTHLYIKDVLNKPFSQKILGDDFDPSKFEFQRKLLLNLYCEGIWSQDKRFLIPSEVPKLIFLGEEYRNIGQYEEAEAIFKDVIERYPMIAEGYHGLASVYSIQNRLDNAKRYYELGLRLNPHYGEFYNDFGVMLMRKKDLSAARTMLFLASKINSSDHKPWLNIGIINMCEGRMGHSYISFKKCLQNNPNNENAKRYIKDLTEMLSEAEIQLLEEKIKENMRLDKVWKTEAIARSNTYDDVLNSDMYDIWMEAAIKNEIEDRQGAYDLLNQLQKALPDNVDILHNMALIKEKEGDIQKAIELYNKILSLEQNNHDAHANLCNIYLKVGKTIEAKFHASKALVGNPNSTIAKYLLAKCLYTVGQKDDSLNILKDALKNAETLSDISIVIRALIKCIESGK